MITATALFLGQMSKNVLIAMPFVKKKEKVHRSAVSVEAGYNLWLKF